ncbi:UDP-galactopyranose mutase (plasmid) [Asticcacaulis sp. MM231]|uniref:UDP-galactopyranose mutase n=1 Tax=Asticcacaulis sp. MM231 TaxID=3157666 RepID=UPI0032D57CF7
MDKTILIVGAGFAGACYARVLAEAGFRVEVIDQRDHIAGNAFDFVDENGVRRHRYGPHLFHTSNERVTTWLQGFGEWVPYDHRVRGRLDDGRFVPIPVNLETINTIFGKSFTTAEEVQAHLASIAIQIEEPKNAAEHLYSQIGTQLTDLFFRPYTKKMWAMDLEDMDAAVVKRIPLRFDLEDRYFPNDAFQLMPRDGYTAIFTRIFDHKNITVRLGVVFDKAMEAEYRHVFNSMPIDEYYDFKLGELPYRSIRFHHRTETTRVDYPWATTNFTDTGPFTRETYWHLLPNHLVNDSGRYTYTMEEPCDYRDNNLERYYPVKTADGRYDKIYNEYKALAGKEARTTFIGRCGTYQYLDMHQVINQSLMGAEAWLKESLDRETLR